MCNPAALIGGLLSVAGSAVQAQQQAAFVNAQNAANKQAYEISKRAREQELARQQAYEQEALSNWDKTSESLGVEQHDEERAASQDRFMQTFDEQASVVPEGHMLSGQENASDAVKQEVATRANQSAADTRKRVQALAALSSYGNVDTSRGTNLNNNANTLSTIGGLRRGSLGVSQFEQNIPAATVTPGSSIIGDVLSGVGGMVSTGFGGGTRVPYSPLAASALSTGRPGLF